MTTVVLALVACTGSPPEDPGSLPAGGTAVPTTTAALSPTTDPWQVLVPSPTSDPTGPVEPSSPPGAMAEDRFWTLVDGTAGPDTDDQVEQVQARLAHLSRNDIVAYEKRLTAVADALLTWQHRGAAEVVLGQVSDDVFRNFRYWVVFRGRDVYRAFRADPDSLAGHGPEDDEQVGAAESLEYAAHDVYRERTGNDLADRDDLPEYTDDLTGVPIDESNSALARRYPRLAARYMRGVDVAGSSGGPPRSIRST